MDDCAKLFWTYGKLQYDYKKQQKMKKYEQKTVLSAILGSLQVPERIRRTEMPCNRI
ncbi:hypothetical protein EfmJHP36_30330 [Enterococcus faecium]|nr:hypothetical protein EfmJHP36_30330 [Enterococcus faecium]